jgi:enoyl-CoA hydratase
LLNEKVEGDVVDAAIEVIDRWNKPASVTSVHLSLLQPSIDEVEKAFVRESEAVRGTEAAIEAASTTSSHGGGGGALLL